MESLTSKRRSRREVLRFAGILGVGVFSRSAMSAQEARSSGHASEVDHLALPGDPMVLLVERHGELRFVVLEM